MLEVCLPLTGPSLHPWSTEMPSALPLKQENRNIYTAWCAPAGHSGICASSRLEPTASQNSVGARKKSQEKNRTRNCIQHSTCETQSFFPSWTLTEATPIQQTDWTVFGRWWGGRFLFCLWIFFHWSLYIISNHYLAFFKYDSSTFSSLHQPLGQFFEGPKALPSWETAPSWHSRSGGEALGALLPSPLGLPSHWPHICLKLKLVKT